MEIDQGFQYLYTKIAQGVKLCQRSKFDVQNFNILQKTKLSVYCRHVNVNIDAIYIRLDGMKYPLVVAAI